eukprot:6462235-Amphidinium_carterae.8
MAVSRESKKFEETDILQMQHGLTQNLAQATGASVFDAGLSASLVKAGDDPFAGTGLAIVGVRNLLPEEPHAEVLELHCNLSNE